MAETREPKDLDRSADVEPTGTVPTGDLPWSAPATPARIGPYRLRRVIASGGMGTVFEAIQETPRRTVALKIMKHGVASRSALRRFEFESQILARLRHPGIAQIFEAGTHDDGSGAVPYFAMEYVPGAKTLIEFAGQSRLGVRERLVLFVAVCDAVHHGHQKGIIHRDLKPANVLVDSSGRPKIIDFGVARATDSDLAVTTLQTDVGQLIGTLQYMSPEQCDADPHDLDVRSDVYSLGVMLYELLCARLPYDLKRVAMHEATRVIREQAPSRLSAVDSRLRGDIETIALKALEKDRNRRYGSAAALAGDIEHYLKDEPIEARPPSMTYQLRMFTRRNRAVVTGAVLATVALVAGTALAGWWAIKADRQSRIASAVNEFLNEDLLSQAAPEAMGRDVTLRQVLDAASEEIEGRFDDDPLVEATVRLTLGRTYERLGEYESAEPHLERALRLRRDALGLDAPGTLTAMTELAQLFKEQGRYDEAEPLLLQATETARAELGLEDERTLEAMTQLGILYRNQSRYEQAEALYDTVLEVRRHELGEDDPSTLVAMENLALLYQRQGRFDESERLFREALAGHRRATSDDDRMTIKITNNLASLYSSTGRYDRAESLLLQVLESYRSRLGDEHHDTLLCLNGLGVLYTRMERLEDSEAMYQEALAGYRRTLGDEHPDTLRCMNNLAFLLFRLDRDEEAEELFSRTLEIRRDTLGDDHEDTLISGSNLGGLYNKMKRYDEGLVLHDETVEGARREFATEHWLTGVFLRKRGQCLTGLARYEEAEADLLEANDLLEKAGIARHERQAKEALVALYEAWERPEKVAEWKARQ